MDLNAYYQHARQWQAQQQAQALRTAQERAHEVSAEWERVYQVVRQALPVEGLHLAPCNHQLDEMPSSIALVEVYAGLPARGARKVIVAGLRKTGNAYQVQTWQVLDVEQDQRLPVCCPEEAFLHIYQPEEVSNVGNHPNI